MRSLWKPVLASAAVLVLADVTAPAAHAQARPAQIFPYYYNPSPAAVPYYSYPPTGGSLNTYYPPAWAGRYVRDPQVNYGPIYDSYYYPNERRYDYGYNTFYYSPGPPNYYPRMSSFYGSPRYWNYYFPGYFQ